MNTTILWELPDALELPFPMIVIGLIINKDIVTFSKSARTNMRIIVGFRPMLGNFDNLDRNTLIFICPLKGEQVFL